MDEYAWLEDMQSNEVKQWVDLQNEFTDKYFENLPENEKISARLKEIWNYPKYSLPFNAGEYYFFFLNEGLQNQFVLYRQKGLYGKPEVFIDPNEFSSDGTVSIIDYSVSWDNKYLGYSLSRKGSDWKEIFIMDINTKERLPDHLTRVKFSEINWHNDGFYYQRYEESNLNKYKEKNISPEIFFHKMGTVQEQDEFIYSDKDNLQNHSAIFTTEDEQYLFLQKSISGFKGNNLHYKDLKSSSNVDFVCIESSFDYIFSVIETYDDAIYICTNKNAPRKKVIKFIPSLDRFEDVISENDLVIESVSLSCQKFFIRYMKDASDIVYVYGIDGKFENEVSMNNLVSVVGFTGRKNSELLFYLQTSFTVPVEIYLYDISTRESELFYKSDFKINGSDFVSSKIFYYGKDGVKIPMFIVHKKDIVFDGNNPALLYGYGGFNISMSPAFSVPRMIFLENGGIYAQACIRGGGEYGESWHSDGSGLKKQNTFDDFIAAAEYMIKENYTSAEKLAIQGRSNGGLLIGSVINQRPELFKAALPEMGVLDMLKFHLFTIGWAWIQDYGSSQDEENFKNLFSYSPLHNIKPQNYPATFIKTSNYDDRVVPLHSFKYAARLQELNLSNEPILLRIITDAGHGDGLPFAKLIEESTENYSFIFHNLGMDVH